MKKKSLVGLVIGLGMCLGLNNLAQADTIGNGVFDRGIYDGWYDFTTIDRTLKFTESAVITDWSIWSGGSGDIYLQVFRNVSGDSYEIVGENFFDNVNMGLNSWAVDDSQQISVLANDYIGFSLTGSVKMAYTNGGNDVRHSNGIGSYATKGMDIPIELANYYGDRTYSIAANFSYPIIETFNDNPGTSPTPTPEPATILLFGIGLVGLAGAARRKKK